MDSCELDQLAPFTLDSSTWACFVYSHLVLQVQQTMSEKTEFLVSEEVFRVFRATSTTQLNTGRCSVSTDLWHVVSIHFQLPFKGLYRRHMLKKIYSDQQIEKENLGFELLKHKLEASVLKCELRL